MTIETSSQNGSGDAHEANIDQAIGNAGGAKEPFATVEQQSFPDSEPAEDVALDFSYDEAVPGFEASASDCFNRALQIAQSLNHTSLSADHLMLALTMDPNARRLLERVGDVAQLREAATQRLGKMHSRFATSDRLPSQTADLVDIRKAARDAASERDQLVAISDLINAFPKADGRLTYGSADGSKAVTLMERIEQGLVPRVAEAMTRIEAEAQEAARRYQSVQSILQDLNARQSAASEQRQIELLEQIRRQVREAADVQIGAALREFGERLEAKFAELNPPVKPIEPAPEPERYEPPPLVHKPRANYWSWLAL